MLNTKETLKKLHKKFPLMSLDELFEILDCYVEDGLFNYKPEPITKPYIETAEPFTYPWTVTANDGSNSNITISNQTKSDTGSGVISVGDTKGTYKLELRN